MSALKKMSTFNNIKELINTINWSKDLLSEMFEKRKSFIYKYEQAAAILEEDRIQTLINKGVIRQNAGYLELDDQFLSFFEQILEVNEDISPAFIDQNIKQIKQHINFYLQENSEDRKYGYLKLVKSALRKLGRITLRNVIDLNRNIENAFKTEPNYLIKIAKLESFDDKRKTIAGLIEQTERLITDDELTFFTTALDEELKQLVTGIRRELVEARHNLIETQKQIIEYLNQVKYQSRVIEKIRQVKYLKDQFEIKHKTNLLQILRHTDPVLFEPKPSYSLKLSLEDLQTDTWRTVVEKVAVRQKTHKHRGLPVADKIADDHLITETEDEIFINLEEIRNGFIASGNHLFNFIMNYRYPREVGYEEKITIFCQMASIYESEFDVTEHYQTDNQVEYAVIKPKQ